MPGGICLQIALRERGDLRHREIDVDAWLEEDLDDRDAGIRLRFDVLDVVDDGGDVALDLAGDAARHLIGRDARVLEGDRDDGDADVREDVRRHAGTHGRAEEHQRAE